MHHPWVDSPTTPEEFEAYLARISCDDQQGYLIREAVFVGGKGRGFMTAALSLVLDDLFGRLTLHRAEANIQPGNARSIALVKRLGFRFEGYSPGSLFIDGAWRDHHRFVITSDLYLR
ncbi:MAG: GNAT family N-acetyltransferase [Candidatus Dormibacteraceae bacterium]